MGAIVLAVLAVVELAVLVASIKTQSSKQEWMRIRTVASVGEVFVLAVLAALRVSGIAFDFR